EKQDERRSPHQRPMTWTGSVELSHVPLPRDPSPPSPRQKTDPSARNAHTEHCWAVIETAGPSPPTSTGATTLSVLPAASSPQRFEPQPITVPSARIASIFPKPAAML